MKNIKFLILSLVLFSNQAIFSAKSVATKSKADCDPMTSEYFKSFTEERDHLNKKLVEYQKAFSKNSLEDFKKIVNSKTLNTEHTYPFLLDGDKMIAHGYFPVDYYKGVACSTHPRHQAWEIIMSSIHNSDKFPIKIFYHFQDNLKETLIQKVSKDGKTYYLGLGFHLES